MLPPLCRQRESQGRAHQVRRDGGHQGDARAHVHVRADQPPDDAAVPLRLLRRMLQQLEDEAEAEEEHGESDGERSATGFGEPQPPRKGLAGATPKAKKVKKPVKQKWDPLNRKVGQLSPQDHVDLDMDQQRFALYQLSRPPAAGVVICGTKREVKAT